MTELLRQHFHTPRRTTMREELWMRRIDRALPWVFCAIYTAAVFAAGYAAGKHL